MANPKARILDASQISVGLKSSYERQVTAEDVEMFAALSGDYNPLHTDPAYASQTNYGRPIVHGAFQVGLASAMVGMYLPGQNVVVGSMRSRFPSPLTFPSTVTVEGEVTVWLPLAGNGTVRVRVIEASQSTLTAEIHVGFGLHENQRVPAAETCTSIPNDGTRPLIVLTGAGSSVGATLLQGLSRSYQVLGLVRSRSRLSSSPGYQDIELVECDLTDENWESTLDAALRGRTVYGIVHAAWPGAPPGGLLGAETDLISRQVEFGTVTTVRLARWLVRHAQSSGRMVVLGTTAATIQPVLNLGAYALGKAAMEQTVRLLAPELAGKGISINAVLPSFMPRGMNRAKTRQAILTETAKVPLGRLCSPEEVAGAIEFLLSDQGGFVAGQILPLTGGRL